MRTGNLVVAPIARDARQNADAQGIEQRLDLPQLADQIEFANDVDVISCGEFRLCRANTIVQQDFGREFVAEIFGAGKTRDIDRNDGCAKFFAGTLAHRFNIVTDQGGHTGLIDKHCRRVVLVKNLAD